MSSQPSITDVQARAGRLISIYSRAHGELVTAITSVKEAPSAKERRALESEVREIIRHLGEVRGPQVNGLIRLSYARGLHLVDPKDKFTERDDQKVGVLASSLEEKLYSAEMMVIRNFADALRRTTLQSAAIALQDSKGVGDKLAVMLRPAGYLDRSGTRWGLLQYAEMAIRTVAGETLTEGTVSAMRRHELELVTVSQVDGTSSPACEPFEGRTFSLVPGNPEYPHLKELPPFHPSCEHYIYSALLGDSNA